MKLKLNKSMEYDSILGKGIYLRKIDDITDIVFIDLRYCFGMGGLSRQYSKNYIVMDHPTQFIESYKAILEKLKSSVKDGVIEYTFNGTVFRHENIIRTSNSHQCLEFSYINQNTITIMAISASYRLINIGLGDNKYPLYRECDSLVRYGSSEIGDMFKVVYGN